MSKSFTCAIFNNAYYFVQIAPDRKTIKFYKNNEYVSECPIEANSVELVVQGKSLLLFAAQANGQLELFKGEELAHFSSYDLDAQDISAICDAQNNLFLAVTKRTGEVELLKNTTQTIFKSPLKPEKTELFIQHGQIMLAVLSSGSVQFYRDNRYIESLGRNVTDFCCHINANNQRDVFVKESHFPGRLSLYRDSRIFETLLFDATQLRTIRVGPKAFASILTPRGQFHVYQGKARVDSFAWDVAAANPNDLVARPRDPVTKLPTELGRGGFGVVYQGTYRQNHVAIKCLPEKKELLAEYMNLSRLDHPNVLTLIKRQDNVSISNPFSICLEFMARGDLFHFLMSRPQVEQVWNARYDIIAQGILSGLDYIHANRILHGDLKTGNVLLDQNLIPKISDFGTMKVLPPNIDYHYSKDITCTYFYAAPECLGYPYTKTYTASDIFSFAAILWEMASHTPAWDGWEVGNVIRAVLKGDFLVPPSTAPYEVQQIIKSCSAYTPSWRPKARDLIDRFSPGRIRIPATTKPFSQASKRKQPAADQPTRQIGHEALKQIHEGPRPHFGLQPLGGTLLQQPPRREPFPKHLKAPGIESGCNAGKPAESAKKIGGWKHLDVGPTERTQAFKPVVPALRAGGWNPRYMQQCAPPLESTAAAIPNEDAINPKPVIQGHLLQNEASDQRHRFLAPPPPKDKPVPDVEPESIFEYLQGFLTGTNYQ